jgi:hypothetical protein
MTRSEFGPDARRRFTLLDVMILVAAVAFGAARSRWYHQQQASLSGFVRLPWPLPIGAEVAPFLMAATIALFVMRLRQPRPRWRRLVRQPGTAACLAGIFTLAMGGLDALHMLIGWLTGGPSFTYITYTLGGHLYGFCVGFGAAVALVWLTMAVLGCRRPEKSWIDRAGRFLGWGAIAYWLVFRVML